jgi:polyhydroxybutyrate depolymerase
MRLLFAVALLAGCSGSNPLSAAQSQSQSPSADLGAADLVAADLAVAPTALTDAGGPAADLQPRALPTGDAGIALIAARPYGSKIPSGYDPNKPTPLVLVLHGFGFNGLGQASYFGLIDLAEARTFLVAYPDGTTNQTGQQFWNATDSCCDVFNTGVDDVAYLNAVIDDMERKYNVDEKRVFVTGHSNGGFMTHRLACDLAPRIAAAVSLAGGQWNDPTRCRPTDKVAVVEVHGDADTTVLYGGGPIAGLPALIAPSAVTTVADWADKNGCNAALDPTGTTLDVVMGLTTRVERHNGCPTGAAAELWTIQGGGHIPIFTPSWAPTIYDYMMAHPKP